MNEILADQVSELMLDAIEMSKAKVAHVFLEYAGHVDQLSLRIYDTDARYNEGKAAPFFVQHVYLDDQDRAAHTLNRWQQTLHEIRKQAVA